ncbi:hypothetical protein, partial [Kozakia baliensis]|uniref:hypothetical protein n=1 Tax=Kozakia baliensis TaxID=153496 RepID=UPI001C99902C
LLVGKIKTAKDLLSSFTGADFYECDILRIERGRGRSRGTPLKSIEWVKKISNARGENYRRLFRKSAEAPLKSTLLEHALRRGAFLGI